MRARQQEVREYVILGHRLEVFPSEDGHWGVAVDGDETPTRLDSSYAAWAVGASESYRRGRMTARPSVHD